MTEYFKYPEVWWLIVCLTVPVITSVILYKIKKVRLVVSWIFSASSLLIATWIILAINQGMFIFSWFVGILVAAILAVTGDVLLISREGRHK